MGALRLVQGTKDMSGKRDYINNLISSEPKTGVLFVDFVESTVARKSKRMGESYGANFKSLVNHVKGFCEEFDADIYTNSVGEDFLDDFILYLESKDLKQGYILNLISLTKAMTARAARYGYAVDQSYDDVNVDAEDHFAVYLSMNEITRVYYFKGLTKKQEEIRDLFVVGCLTALRYSDYSTLTKANFTKDFIIKKTQKTGKKVTIPIHTYIHEIYDKYEGEVSKGLSIQHFNRYIKKICQRVGLTDSITYNFTRGGKLITETKEKWELISSHTARRSAATNLYQLGRLRTYEIMALTGHTTEKSFFRYIKTSDEDKAAQIAGDSFFKK